MSAKIYKVSSPKGNKVYIGSTSRSLKSRLVHHLKFNRTTTSRLLIDEYGSDSCCITLLEETTREQRYERERWWIENTPNVVNMKLPGRTDAQYKADKREEILIKAKIYREKRKEYNSEETPCPKCGKIMRRDSIRKHLKVMHL